MRWIFVTLVLLNFVYFGWGYWQQLQSPSIARTVAEVPDPPTPASQQDLVLLTERLPAPSSPAPPPTIAAPEPPPMPLSLSEPEQQICARIGPYTDRAQGVQIQQQLIKSGFDATISEAVAGKQAQFWVVLPPVETRRRALQTLRELQARKIDSYLVSAGEMKNAISLGLFTRNELARGVQDKIREAGYPAEIRRTDKVENAFWVQFVAKQPFENARKVLDELIPSASGIKISNTPCEMFAQSN